MTRMNLQGGDNDSFSYSFLTLTFPFIKPGASVLNLGCGSRFNFERILKEEKNARITSCDIILPATKPDFVDELVLQSVEEEFSFDQKFDVVSFFELIEHIDKTDMLLKNCFNNLRDDGYLLFSCPNLSSIYARIELLLGYQPHILEVSNEYPNFGTGIFGRLNNNKGETLHHIRGITYKALVEMIAYHGFKIIKVIGYDYRLKRLFNRFSGFAPINIFVCRKDI